MTNEVQTSNQRDVYRCITSQIVASLEKGVRPWVKPWNAEHAAGSGGRFAAKGAKGELVEALGNCCATSSQAR